MNKNINLLFIELARLAACAVAFGLTTLLILM